VNVAQNRYLYKGKELQEQAIGGTPSAGTTTARGSTTRSWEGGTRWIRFAS